MKLRFPAIGGGVRRRLFFASVLVVSLVILIAGLIAHAELRRWLEERIEDELGHKLAAARVAAEVSAAPPDDALADRLGAALGVRVSFIDAAGVVRGDSEVTAAALRDVENHATRPEVREAHELALGRDRRLSHTVHKEMLYLAGPWTRPDGKGTVRVAADYGEIGDVARRLRVLLAAAGGLGLLAAVVMSGIGSHLLSRTLRALVAHARSLAGEQLPGAGAAGARDDGDEIGGLAGTLQRLATDLGRAVSSLADERDRFAAVLEAMVEGVIGLDRTGRVVFVNAAARGLLGAPPDAVGKSLLELARVPALEEAARVARGGAVAAVEVELLGLLGPAPRTLLVRAAPVRAGGAVIVLHDVTDVRRLERVRRDFVANVSHELRTPVSVIRANAETLLLGGLEDIGRAAGFVEAIDRNAERLARLVGDLLDLSRIEAGQVKLDLEPVPVRELCLQAVESVDVRARERGHEIHVDVAEDLWARADERALDQVLVNLLDNAVKYTPPGGRIRLGATAQGDRLRLEVEDDGPGIEARHRARLFERFYRVDSGRARDVGGTGLGLAIVKHLVEAMGGRVAVEPARERGSVFVVDLPLASAATDELTAMSQS